MLDHLVPVFDLRNFLQEFVDALFEGRTFREEDAFDARTNGAVDGDRQEHHRDGEREFGVAGRDAYQVARHPGDLWNQGLDPDEERQTEQEVGGRGRNEWVSVEEAGAEDGDQESDGNRRKRNTHRDSRQVQQRGTDQESEVSEDECSQSDEGTVEKPADLPPADRVHTSIRAHQQEAHRRPEADEERGRAVDEAPKRSEAEDSVDTGGRYEGHRSQSKVPPFGWRGRIGKARCDQDRDRAAEWTNDELQCFSRPDGHGRQSRPDRKDGDTRKQDEAQSRELPVRCAQEKHGGGNRTGDRERKAKQHQPGGKRLGAIDLHAVPALSGRLDFRLSVIVQSRPQGTRNGRVRGTA